MPIPCVLGNLEGLSVFQTTADQRYLLGEDLFEHTHLPVRFWVEQAGKRTLWTEQQLLETLLEESRVHRGNRVFMLFGAAGAGKSEVMRWLMLQVARKAPARNRFCLRVSRTDMDPVRIVHRLMETFGDCGLSESAMIRWEELKRKPVALANQVVWQALTGLFDSDEEILALSYRLRSVVEQNLRAGFAVMVDASMADRPLQLLMREQLEHVLGDTVLEVDPVYEHLRSHVQAAFDQAILGDVKLVPLLRQLSQKVREEHGVRPILVIDDLVQSMNVYSTDLLDYLITLEEGEWDVVLGLTPAAFEWDRRGRELLLRIRELDTVDDRVTKLDLSDPTGDSSAFLDEGTMAQFLTPYLSVYKQSAGYACGQACPHWSNCRALQWGQTDDVPLSPFNPALVRRLWRNLPRGKGRARHLLWAARTALQAMATSGVGALPVLSELVERDLFVNHPDQRVRQVVELFHSGEGGDSQAIPSQLGDIWQIGNSQPAEVHELRPVPEAVLRQRDQLDSATEEQDPVRLAIRDWLEGGHPNGELLKPLRCSVTRLLREVVDPSLLAGIGYAQPNGVLRRAQVENGVNLPVRIAGVDEGPGLLIRRDLGSRCFELLEYVEAKGPTRTRIAGRLVSDPVVAQLILEASEQQRTWCNDLALRLGCSVSELAFHTFRVALALGADLPIPVVMSSEAVGSLPGIEWPNSLVRTIRQLWEDCFRIRDHVYDGHRLSRFMLRWPHPVDSVEELERIPRTELPDSFRLGDRPLREVLAAIHEHVGSIRERLSREVSLWSHRVTLGQACARFLDGRSRRGLGRRWPSFMAAVDGEYRLSPFPGAPSAEDSEVINDLLKDLRIADPHADIVHAYRLSCKWVRAERLPWFLEVSRWETDLRMVCGEASPELSRRHVTVAEPGDIGRWMDKAMSLLLARRRERAFQASTGALRTLLSDPAWDECRKLARLLELLAPTEFAIGTRLAPVRKCGLKWVSQWERASSWLNHPDTAKNIPTLSKPEAEVLRALHLAVREAAEWWAWFTMQITVLAIPRLDCETDARSFLSAVLRAEYPGEVLQVGWERFLTRARRRRLFDLPALSEVQKAELPATLTELLQALVVVGGRKVTLGDLPAQTLELLQERMPNLAQTIHLRMTPEGVGDGVLRLVD